MIVVNNKYADVESEGYDIQPYMFSDVERVIDKMVEKKHLLYYRPVPISMAE